jgi:hypothetical protein
MLIAWLKLRQRNLGPILDANGWAVNGRVKMNVPFGGSLTHVAELPPGAQPSFAVAYPEAPTALPKLITTAIILCFLGSLLNHFGIVHLLTSGRIGKPPPNSQPPAALEAPAVLVTPSTNAPAAK